MAHTAEEGPPLSGRGSNLQEMVSSWCSARNLDPANCEIVSVFTFLQELLDGGHAPSMLRVYVAAVTVNHTLISDPWSLNFS